MNKASVDDAASDKRLEEQVDEKLREAFARFQKIYDKGPFDGFPGDSQKRGPTPDQIASPRGNLNISISDSESARRGRNALCIPMTRNEIVRYVHSFGLGSMRL